jgi:hypothetical protein
MKEKGFTMVLHVLLNALLLAELTQRQLTVILLIVRLTYGCRRRWVTLKSRDFEKVGIGSTHIRLVIDPLIERDLILWKKDTKQFRINEEYIIGDLIIGLEDKLSGLNELISQTLANKSYHNGKEKLTKEGINELPNWEDTYYQNGNLTEPTSDSAKDNSKYSLNIDKNIIPYKGKVNPQMFVPQNSGQEKALETWKKIELDNPDSFDFYLKALKRGLPISYFDDYSDMVLSDHKIKNKGAAFVNLVEEYFKNEFDEE